MSEKPTGGLKGANMARQGAGRGPAPSTERPPITPAPGARLEQPIERRLAPEGDGETPPPPVQEPEAPPVSRETPLPADEPLDDVPLDEGEDGTLQERALAKAAFEEIEANDEADELGQGLFTAAELEDMRKGAAAKVEKDKKAALKLELMERFEEEERARQGLAPKRGPVDDKRKMGVTIGLPPFASEIALDNRLYFNGHTYEVTPAVFAALVDQMQHSWRHEDEINGHLNEPQRRERDTYVRGGTKTRAGAVSRAPMALNTRTSMSH